MAQARKGQSLLLRCQMSKGTEMEAWGRLWTAGHTTVGPDRGQQRPPCRLQQPRAPLQATERTATSCAHIWVIYLSGSQSCSVITLRWHLLRGCWGCSISVGSGCLFSPDMTDAAHCAADRTLENATTPHHSPPETLPRTPRHWWIVGK